MYRAIVLDKTAADRLPRMAGKTAATADVPVVSCVAGRFERVLIDRIAGTEEPAGATNDGTRLAEGIVESDAQIAGRACPRRGLEAGFAPGAD